MFKNTKFSYYPLLKLVVVGFAQRASRAIRKGKNQMISRAHECITVICILGKEGTHLSTDNGSEGSYHGHPQERGP